MPNVMGREFPYTPEGMAQAEQYKQAMGMRGGGMMGFRPLGYADGNLVTAMAQRPRREDLEDEGLDVYLGLQSLLEEGDRQKILDYLYLLTQVCIMPVIEVLIPNKIKLNHWNLP